MGLRTDSVGGGQFKGQIKQIMEAEAQPVKQLEGRKAREEARLKLFNEFKNKFAATDKAVRDIENFKKFRELKVDMGDGQHLASVTIDKDKAQPGTYSIQIDELAARSSVISNGMEDPDAPELGIGFVVMNLGNGESAEIFVDEEHASLRGIASLINAQDKSPVRAAVIKDASDPDEPWRLILTAKGEGSQNDIEFPEFYFLDGSKDFYVDNDRKAKNAILQIDGFPIELDSNDAPDFLPGVALHLKQARPEQPFTLTITEDHQKIAGKVKTVIDKINEVFGFITQQNAVDEKSDTRSTFAGDTGLQTIEYRIRNLMHEGFPVPTGDDGSYRLIFLNQLGIEFEKSGQLKFNEEKFTKAVERDFEGVAEGITGSFGLAFQLKEVLGTYTRPGDGLLSMREQGIKSRIKNYDRQIDDKMRQLERKQTSLINQFSKLEASLGNLQRQQQYLSAALPSGGGGLIGQLMGTG